MVGLPGFACTLVGPIKSDASGKVSNLELSLSFRKQRSDHKNSRSCLEPENEDKKSRIWSNFFTFLFQSTQNIIDLPHPLALYPPMVGHHSTSPYGWVACAPCWGWMGTGRWQKRPEKAAASKNDGEAFYYRESPGVEEGRGRVAAVVIGIYPTMYCFQSAPPTTPPIPTT